MPGACGPAAGTGSAGLVWALLPADERALAEQWATTRRGQDRVEAVRGRHVTLSDRTDGAGLRQGVDTSSAARLDRLRG